MKLFKISRKTITVEEYPGDDLSGYRITQITKTFLGFEVKLIHLYALSPEGNFEYVTYRN